MKLIKIKGIYTDIGRIELENNKSIDWSNLIDGNPVYIPFGSAVEISVVYEDYDFLSGRDGIVWGSYDLRQIEIIKNALFAQNIITDVNPTNLGNRKIFLLSVINKTEADDAISFIWKSKSGLRLKPDWSYLNGKPNKSFEQWLNGQ